MKEAFEAVLDSLFGLCALLLFGYVVFMIIQPAETAQATYDAIGAVRGSCMYQWLRDTIDGALHFYYSVTQ